MATQVVSSGLLSKFARSASRGWRSLPLLGKRPEAADTVDAAPTEDNERTDTDATVHDQTPRPAASRDAKKLKLQHEVDRHSGSAQLCTTDVGQHASSSSQDCESAYLAQTDGARSGHTQESSSIEGRDEAKCAMTTIGMLAMETLPPADNLHTDSFVTPRGNTIGSPGTTVWGQNVGQLGDDIECVGFSSVQNNRPYQEDRAKVLRDHDIIHVGIFDGHAGDNTSSFLQQHLLGAVIRRLHDGVPCTAALQSTFIDTNNELRKMRSSYTSGSTATIAVVSEHEVVCACAGDSPAFIIGRDGNVTCLTVDHAPSNESERVRIEAAGGRIQRMGWGGNQPRVLSHDNLSGLAMTRAFGDFNFLGVICDPHISHAQLPDDAMYLVLASDGLTERWSIDGVGHTVRDAAANGCSARKIAGMLSECAINFGSRDNITVIVLDLKMYRSALS